MTSCVKNQLRVLRSRHAHDIQIKQMKGIEQHDAAVHKFGVLQGGNRSKAYIVQTETVLENPRRFERIQVRLLSWKIIVLPSAEQDCSSELSRYCQHQRVSTEDSARKLTINRMLYNIIHAIPVRDEAPNSSSVPIHLIIHQCKPVTCTLEDPVRFLVSATCIVERPDMKHEASRPVYSVPWPGRHIWRRCSSMLRDVRANWLSFTPESAKGNSAESSRLSLQVAEAGETVPRVGESTGEGQAKLVIPGRSSPGTLPPLFSPRRLLNLRRRRPLQFVECETRPC